MKKLIPALAMLLVAACLMGTSTYAWFSANKEVTASGMSVKAATDGGLAIAAYNDGGNEGPKAPAETKFASAATLNKAGGDWVNGADTIKPTSFNGTNWFSGTSATADSYAANTMATLGTGYTDLAGYMQHTKWALKSLKDGANAKVYVTSITVSATDGSTALLDNSLRVAIKTADAWLIFAPMYASNTTVGGDTGLNYVASYAVDAQDNNKLTVTKGSTNIKVGNEYSDALIFKDLGTTAELVDVYVYYEGQDEHCNTAYATGINTLNVTIAYEAVENN